MSTSLTTFNLTKAATRSGPSGASLALLLTLAACGGGGGGGYGGGGGTPPPPPTYQITSLVTDQAFAGATTDNKLVNPWGLAYGPTTQFWVADQASSTSTVYDGAGAKNTTVGNVGVPVMGGVPMNGPTGIVFNGSADFAGEKFIIVSLAGCVCSWSTGSDMIRRVDNTTTGAVYTGVATGTVGTVSYLYAANLASGNVDVFDGSYAPANLGASAFVDPTLPAGYSVYNVQNMGGKLYVTYAKHSAGSLRESTGPGLGVINVFNTDGTFVRRFATGGSLNAPWGMALAPSNFGPLSNALLVGNFGDGRITAFDATTGAQLGQLSDAAGTPFSISGLWALSFGNGGTAGMANQLYFTSGPQGETRGLFATISYGPPPTNGGGGGGGGYGY